MRQNPLSVRRRGRLRPASPSRSTDVEGLPYLISSIKAHLMSLTPFSSSTPGDDIRKLEITLRHYEAGYESQAVQISKLQGEIVKQQATNAYLQQCLEEERAKNASSSTSSSVEPTTMRGGLALDTPPWSDRGSVARSSTLEDRIQRMDSANSPSPLKSHAHNVTVTYSKKRKIAPDPEPSHDRQPLSVDDSSLRNSHKKQKSMVHVLIPSLSQAKRRAFSKARTPPPDYGQNMAGSSRMATVKLEPEEVVQPLMPPPSELEEQVHLRSCSRDVSYFDEPNPSRVTTYNLRKRPSRLTNSSPTIHSPASSRAAERGGIDRAQGSDVQMREKGIIAVCYYFSSQKSPSPGPDAVDRWGDMRTLDVQISDKTPLLKVATRLQLSTILGGCSLRTCVSSNGRNFFYPTHEYQPWRPCNPGQPGLFLHANPTAQWEGDIQTVFVALYQAKYRYVGEYKMTQAEPLSSEEFKTLSPVIKKRWVDYVRVEAHFKAIRIRIVTRRDQKRGATAQEVLTAVGENTVARTGDLTAEDVMRAYESGEEASLLPTFKRFFCRLSCLLEDACLADAV
ncbi:hypothetical protein DICSQDRAFT_184070 [Dichomitus squalens LYAD-421 SS1]|uniref:DUF6697 domain-containing protein n=1 Tax=Dichomitus squalens (strain LYAD-421) TaxID=732165 RepID=R7SIF6_DICSQ|nr:uncharacterized protein DICSQDRAFT_184070 [Dichomitus squalens LYAD-421 SS1]EJF55946.1 hypothetical protein DICSQDRAFT_184070 [Dichomitus squalens LYAD-421 SS1]